MKHTDWTSFDLDNLHNEYNDTLEDQEVSLE